MGAGHKAPPAKPLHAGQRSFTPATLHAKLLMPSSGRRAMGSPTPGRAPPCHSLPFVCFAPSPNSPTTPSPQAAPLRSSRLTPNLLSILHHIPSLAATTLPHSPPSSHPLWSSSPSPILFNLLRVERKTVAAMASPGGDDGRAAESGSWW
ncbi:hypothetical protein Droror1_Dr00023304 [Drosera rotundifolia]